MERGGDETGLRFGPIPLVEERVLVAVGARRRVVTARVLDPVGGTGDELLGPDIGIVTGSAAGPGAVKILAVWDRH